MVSLFLSFSNQGGEDPFYREREASLSCKFPMWDCLLQRKFTRKRGLPFPIKGVLSPLI